MLYVIVAVVAGIIIWRIEAVNQKLQDAIDQQNLSTQRVIGRLGSMKAYIQGVPALVGAAVAAALAQHDVDEAAAADTIAAATAATENAVNDAFAAIETNPAEGDEATGSVADAPVETVDGNAVEDNSGAAPSSDDGSSTASDAGSDTSSSSDTEGSAGE